MRTLPDLPAELDPAYVAPEEPIEVTGREPRFGEWVNVFRPVPNGDRGEVRRGQDRFLGQVTHVQQAVRLTRDDFIPSGVSVRIWSREAMKFTEEFFAPWCCVASRAAVNYYSLTGQCPSTSKVEA